MPLIQAPVLPAKVTEAKKISGQSLSIPVPSRKVESPAPDLDFMTTKGKLKRELLLPSDALRASKSIPCQPDEKYHQSVSLALSFQNIFRISPTALPSAVDLAAHFQLVKQKSAALAFAANFD